MKKNNIKIAFLFVSALFGLALQAENIQFITSAPTGAPGEPIYGDDFSSSVDWFSEPIDGNYYVAALAPQFQSTGGSSPDKTIAIYRFIPGNPPTAGSLEFVASAPTGQCIFDQLTQQDVCDENFLVVNQVSWFPSSINGEYFFTVVGSLVSNKLGVPGQQSIRVYRFNPDKVTPANGTITFIDSAPLQSEEPAFARFFWDVKSTDGFIGLTKTPLPFTVEAVDWFSGTINNKYYFTVVGLNAQQVRVYSFDPTAPLGTNLSLAGEDNIDDFNGLSVDWLPELVNGKSYFAVGGEGFNDQEIRVYQFCTDPCEGTATSPEDHVRLIVTAPTSAVLDSSILQANSVEWLVVNGRYYLAVAVFEDSISLLRTQRPVRIYEFIPGKKDPTQGTLRFVTSAPTGKECCADQVVDDNLQLPSTLDWLTQNERYFLAVGAGNSTRAPAPEDSIRVYEFNSTKEKLSFIAAEDLSPDVPLSVDWFPGLIEGNNYFAAGFQDSGTVSEEVRIYKFRPPCNFAGLSCRGEE